VTKLSTSLRVRPLEETLAMATALMPAAGISAVEDATATDVLGVPVWFSHRPAGLASTVHAGKGVHPREAQVGALMEAFEYAAAESEASRSTDRRMSLGAVLQQFSPALTLADLAPRLGARPTPDTALRVEHVDDLRTGRRCDLPAELVLVPAPAGDQPALFGWTSNGLASGNTIDEATLHALLEVLERDAIALDLAQPSRRCWPLHTLPEPFRGWAQDWSAMGIALRIRHLDSAFGLPCFEAEITAAGPHGAQVARGWGLHLDRQVALSRAVTEAAQSRLHARRYAGRAGGTSRNRAGLPTGEAAGHDIDGSSVPSLPCSDIASALALLLGRLEAQGLHGVLRRRMTLAMPGQAATTLQVVKVIVPGCEDPTGAEPRIGRRLAQRLIRTR
jgi:ribosomal protein S12 methylthiotransferase accessory factor